MAGGSSIGCPQNAGAAGTFFNANLRSLRVGNDYISTATETPLLDFPTSKLWSNVIVENNAKVLVPLLWTRVQVITVSILLDRLFFLLASLLSSFFSEMLTLLASHIS